MTIYTQIHEGPEHPTTIPPEDWTPWINCTGLDQTIQIALNRHIRDRGGLLPGENPLVVRVLTVCEADMRASQGKPKTAFCTVFNVRPN